MHMQLLPGLIMKLGTDSILEFFIIKNFDLV